MVAVAFIITILAGAVLYVVLGSDSRRIAEMQITAAVLAQAREALIGRAASDNNRPGSLPCPDLVTNIPGINVPNDGIADLLVGNECPSYIGRLPWRTLDLPDLRDASGERLWYALSRAFRDDNSAQPINTNTTGTLSISGSMMAGNLVAIVFAPGPVVANQVRDTPNANSVENYLEGGNQASGTTAFIAAATTASFNDQSLVLGGDALLPVVETRVAREARSVLAAFYTAKGFFPTRTVTGTTLINAPTASTAGAFPGFSRTRASRPPEIPTGTG